MKNNTTQKNTKKLETLIDKHALFPQRFLLTENNNFMYSESNKDLTRVMLSRRRFNILRSSAHFHDRGKLLEDIMVIEFLLSQIVFLKLSTGDIIFFDYEKVKDWNNILDNLTFDRKIKLVSEWYISNDKKKQSLYRIKNFRNELAHSFSSKYFEYCNKSIKDNFQKFEKDFYDSLNTLIDINNKLWKQNNLLERTIEWIEEKYEK